MFQKIEIAHFIAMSAKEVTSVTKTYKLVNAIIFIYFKVDCFVLSINKTGYDQLKDCIKQGICHIIIGH